MAEDIDLSNFDEPRFEKSKYVLTSPRSLRACANVGIKPVELLPQTFSQFITSNCSTCIGFKSCNVSSVYKEHERQRRVKLWKARRERQRIIESESTKTKIRKVVAVSSPTPYSVTVHTPSPLLTISTKSPMIPVKDQRILDAMLRKKQNELEIWSSEGDKDSQLKFERASLNKEMIDEIKQFSVKAKNYDKQKRFQRNKSFLEEEKKQNEEYARELAKHKDEEIDIRLQQRNSLKEEEGIWKKKKQELRQKQIKLAVEDLTAEVEQWRQNVDEINKNNMARALDTSQRLLHEKKCLLQQKTKEKEAAHRQAMTRLQEDEERTREYNIKEIHQKNERIDNLMRQKAEQSFQALKTSQHTAHLRESIKDTNIFSDSFKQKIIHAQQRVALENRTKEKRDPERHSSTVTFG